MREIKFEYIIDTQAKSDRIIKEVHSIDEIENDMAWISLKAQTWKVIARRQFTGLKDKRGKEIYEGDIVMHKYFEYSKEKEIVGVIEFRECCFSIRCLSCEYKHYHLLDSHTDIEIIGNIYENPELVGDLK